MAHWGGSMEDRGPWQPSQPNPAHDAQLPRLQWTGGSRARTGQRRAENGTLLELRTGVFRAQPTPSFPLLALNGRAAPN